MEIIQKLIDSVEKIFRYLLPGFIFLLLFNISYPPKSWDLILKSDNFKFSILIVGIGALIYALHRLLFEFLDLFISKIIPQIKNGYFENYIKTIESIYPINKKGNDDKLRDYLIYKFALSHLILIFSELVLIFSFYFDTGSILESNYCLFRILAILILTLSLIHYFILHYIQRQLLEPRKASHRNI